VDTSQNKVLVGDLCNEEVNWIDLFLDKCTF